jgi:predicted dehydrogenase
MPRTRDVDVIFDLCIHDVDVAAYLLGELKLINAVGIEKDGILEHVAAKFKAGRTLVDIESSRLSPVKIRKFYMLDKEKMLEGNYITQRIEIQKGVKARGYPKTFGEFVLRGIQTTKESLNLIPEEPLKIELEHFIKCVQEHKEPMITNDDVLRAMELSEEIKASVVL